MTEATSRRDPGAPHATTPPPTDAEQGSTTLREAEQGGTTLGGTQQGSTALRGAQQGGTTLGGTQQGSTTIRGAQQGSTLRGTWPLHRRDAIALVVAYLGLVGLFVAIGALIVGPLDDSALGDGDRDVARWFADRRTSGWNDAASLGALLADTVVKVVVTAAAVGIMLIAWRRWREPLLVVVALVLEASAFITVTWIVGRPRPDVPRLEESPVDSSFPSGHTAAAAAYAAVAIVIFWHTRRRWIRVVVAVVTVTVPIVVGVSRAYAGMHYVSDVVAGVVLGGASTAAAWFVLRRPDVADHTVAERQAAGRPPPLQAIDPTEVSAAGDGEPSWRR